MLDLTTEKPIPLNAATALVPPGRNGKRTHLSTLLRWILDGSRSTDGTVVKLEALRFGGRWVTSREALQRFAERLTPRASDTEAVSPAPTCRVRIAAAERTARELDNIGL